MDMLERAHRWLADQLKAHLSQEVVYRRGADSVVVSATIARRVFSVAQGDTVTYVRGQDFLIKSNELVLGGQPVLPERGDEIDTTLSTGQTFVVLPDEGFPPWEYADPYEHLFRIHTKHLED